MLRTARAITLLALLTGPLAPATASGADPPFRPLSATDQLAVAFPAIGSERRIFVTNAEGTTAFVTIPSSFGGPRFLAWPLGSGTLAATTTFGAGGSHLRLYEYPDGVAHDLTAKLDELRSRTDQPRSVSPPVWSGSSSTIRILTCVGQSTFSASSTDLKVIKIRPDGSGGQAMPDTGSCLTTAPLVQSPFRVIVRKRSFEGAGNNSTVDLFVRDLATGAETALTDFHGDAIGMGTDGRTSEHSAAPSPDGTKVAYLREAFVAGTIQGDQASLGQSEEFGQLGIVNANGTGRTEFPLPVTGTSASPRQLVFSSPAWRPDGQRIALIGTEVGNGQFLRDALYSIKPDGTDLVRHTPFDPWPNLATANHFARDVAWGTLCQTLTGCNASITLVSSAGALDDFELVSRPALNGPASVGFLVQRQVGKRFKRVGRVPFGTRRRGARLRWNLRLDGKPLKAGTYRIRLRVLSGKIPLELSRSVDLVVPRRGAPHLKRKRS